MESPDQSVIQRLKDKYQKLLERRSKGINCEVIWKWVPPDATPNFYDLPIDRIVIKQQKKLQFGSVIKLGHNNNDHLLVRFPSPKLPMGIQAQKTPYGENRMLLIEPESEEIDWWNFFINKIEQLIKDTKLRIKNPITQRPGHNVRIWFRLLD